MKRIIYPLLALTLAFSSLGLKAAIIETQKGQPEKKEMYPPQLADDLRAGAFNFIKTVPLANDKVYAAGIYRSPLCKGWLAVVKINRNAEGVNLLPALFNKYDPRIRFVVAGDYYEKFPELKFAWNRFVGSTFSHVGMEPSNDPTAWAVAETGTCQIA